MAKRNRIIYWIATLWLALGMASTGTVQLLKIESKVSFIIDMGYPAYFLILIGTWKILGVLTILMPGFALLKEWAYAGFFFCMTGAIFSHIAVGNPVTDMLPPLLLLVLTIISWSLRSADRRIGRLTVAMIA